MTPPSTLPAVGGEGHESHRLAATVAGGQNYKGAFKNRVGNTSEAEARGKDYVLCPDVSVESFESWVEEVEGIVGKENVLINISSKFEDQAKSSYIDQPAFVDFFPIDDPEKYQASAQISPASVDEVSAVVKACNKYGQPIHAVSIGRNLGYGGSAPRLRGTAIMNLRRMDKILEVNEESAYCFVEPGVTYFELYEHLQSLGSKLWIDCPDIGWGSVIGNTTERGAGYTPYGDHYMFHCGMEVVLPDGKVIRTGLGSMPNSDGWGIFQHGVGPSHDGIFTQSNLGIVTKMGMWLMPDPGGFKPFLITIEKKDQLHELFERLRPLRNTMTIQNGATVRHVLLDAACIKSKSEWQGGNDSGVLSDERVDEIAKELDLGVWNFYGALYGPPPIQDLLWSVIWGSLSQIKGSKAFFEGDVGPSSILHSRAKTLNGIPNLLELDWVSWAPNGAHCFFSPISPVTGKAATGQYELVKKIAGKYGFDFINTFVIGLRELHNITCLVYDKTNKEQRDKMRACLTECINEAAKMGWGEYRTHPAFYDQIAGTYSFNNHALSDLNNTLKDSLDPNGILSPGKYGVWPKRYRGKGL